MLKSNFHSGCRAIVRLASLIIVALLISACTTIPRNALPTEQISAARIVGMPDGIRAQGLAPSATLQHDFARAMVDGGRESACDERAGQPVFCVLIISGGGGMGAYGAGVINGWTESGDRPNFKIVTGVSTGALMAPFAFLGADWDDQLRDAFTTVEGDEDIVTKRGMIGILTHDSITATNPLIDRIASMVGTDMLSAIAREYRAGRRLYIGTTNMDAQSLTVWNIGAIADSGRPDALELFQKILLASASIPIAMPPVMFEVEVNGEIYDEMHSDGGVQAQFFVPLVVIDLPAAIREAQAAGFPYSPTPRMYVIRNSTFTPQPKSVDRNLATITTRTVASMTQSMGRADLYQIYAVARARGDDFRYTEVPADFQWQSEEEFNGEEMRRLFEVGYQNGLDEATWQRTPPGLFATNTEATSGSN